MCLKIGLYVFICPLEINHYTFVILIGYDYVPYIIFTYDIILITLWGWVTHICVSKFGHHWFRNWFVVWSAPNHYLNQCWNIVNLNHRNKRQWNLKQKAYIFIQENAFANVIWEMSAILSRPQCVNYPAYPAACSVLMSFRTFMKLLHKSLSLHE